jgi:hypothetical protein
VVDHDLCYDQYFQDPYGNGLELDCYEYAKVKKDLIIPPRLGRCARSQLEWPIPLPNVVGLREPLDS